MNLIKKILILASVLLIPIFVYAANVAVGTHGDLFGTGVTAAGARIDSSGNMYISGSMYAGSTVIASGDQTIGLLNVSTVTVTGYQSVAGTMSVTGAMATAAITSSGLISASSGSFSGTIYSTGTITSGGTIAAGTTVTASSMTATNTVSGTRIKCATGYTATELKALAAGAPGVLVLNSDTSTVFVSTGTGTAGQWALIYDGSTAP